MLSIAFSFYSAYFPHFCGPRPSAPVSAVGASLRAGRYPVRHFCLDFQHSAPISHPFDFHISGSSYFRSAAFAPALLVWDRRAQASAAPLLRCKFSIFSFSFTAVVWRCPGLPLYCRLAIRPPHALPPRGALRQGFGSRRGQPRLPFFPLLSSTYSSHLLPFFTYLWPAAFRGSLALTPAGRYPLRHILFGLARRLPLASKVRPARRAP